jgi:hypothetical protein
MMMRGVLALAVLAGAAGPVAAGEFGCRAGCYRQTTLPPVYGTLTDRVLLGTSQTQDIVTLPEYRTIAETVQVAPARREWRVTRDAWGRKVGCWVVVPASYAVQQRTVMVRQPAVAPVSTYPIYGVRYRSVQLAPARRAWVPRAYATYVEAGFPAY